MKDIRHNPRDFAGGIAMGIDQGAYLGIPHSIVEYITGKRVDRDSTAYWAGKVIGDLASMIQGVYTIAAGVGQELIGGGLDLTGVGAILGGLELNAAGAVTIVYGGTVVVSSAASMSSDLNMLFSKVQDGFGNNGTGSPTTSWKSVKEYGHTFNTHGSGAKNTKSLTDRARSTGNNQGQWLDNQKAAEYLKSLGDIKEPPTVSIPEGLGQVITPTGEIVSATKAIVVPSATGIKTAYPIP